MDLKEQYQHPKWQKKRLEILERDNWTCQECGNSEKQLHVHHLYYVKGEKLYDAHPNHLKTLCFECHNSRHELIGFINEAFASMSNKELKEFFNLLQ